MSKDYLLCHDLNDKDKIPPEPCKVSPDEMKVMIQNKNKVSKKKCLKAEYKQKYISATRKKRGSVCIKSKKKQTDCRVGDQIKHHLVTISSSITLHNHMNSNFLRSGVSNVKNMIKHESFITKVLNQRSKKREDNHTQPTSIDDPKMLLGIPKKKMV